MNCEIKDKKQLKVHDSGADIKIRTLLFFEKE